MPITHANQHAAGDPTNGNPSQVTPGDWNAPHVGETAATHAGLPDVTANQHHAQLHAAAHRAGGGDPLALELDYAQFTANVNITHTTEATADTLVTGAAVAYDGATPVVISCFVPWLTIEATQTVVLCLYDGAASVGLLAAVAVTGAVTAFPVEASVRLTPTNGNHTYSLRAYISGGNGIANAGAGGLGNGMPGFIRIARA